MRLRLLILLAAFFHHSANAGAGEYTVNVCGLQSSATSDIAYLRVCGTWASKNNCVASSHLAFDMNKFQGKTMYSTALAALASGLPIIMVVDGISGNCITGHDALSVIEISK
ncbi:hypothetical protein ACU6U9_16260 [Pseudomonas sp. HK3]|jgi:hypothetical protein